MPVLQDRIVELSTEFQRYGDVYETARDSDVRQIGNPQLVGLQRTAK